MTSETHKAAVREKLTENRRLCILRLLAEDPDGAINTSMLQDALAVYRIDVSRAVLHADGAWLEDVGAVMVENVANVRIFTITALGLDHVERRTIIPGIKRPAFT